MHKIRNHQRAPAGRKKPRKRAPGLENAMLVVLVRRGATREAYADPGRGAREGGWLRGRATIADGERLLTNIAFVSLFPEGWGLFTVDDARNMRQLWNSS
jgi:hypothetical protein